MQKKSKPFVAWIIIVVFLGTIASYFGELVPVENTHTRAPALNSSFGFSSSTLYAVAHVVDGDTLDVDVGGTLVRLRLLGVNTPESVDTRKPVECFGQEASARAKMLLSGTSVYVETDSTQGLHDKYGRTLAYVTLRDGTLFNGEIIAEGYAHEYTHRYPYKYQQEFKAAERLAREGGRGLWAPGACPVVDPIRK